MIWYAIIVLMLGGTPSRYEYERIYGTTHYDTPQDVACLEVPPGNAPIPGTPHHDALLGFIEPQQGSGMGITPHLFLGPGRGRVVSPPATPGVHDPPPLNNGQAGVPVDLPPDDPPPETGTDGTCSTIGDIDEHYFNVDNYILRTSTMTASQESKFTVAKDQLKRLILTTTFKNNVLSETYCNTSMTTAQVWARICSGRENWRPTEDNQIDAYQEVYAGTQGTIGYVSSVNADTINSNSYYMNQYDPSNVAGHVMHEWTHLLGYSHSGGDPACGNEGDVSYEVGSFMSARAETIDDDYGW